MNTLYKDNNGQVYSISPIQKPKEDWIKLTEEEIELHLNPIVPIEVQEANKRKERDDIINSFTWRIERNSQEMELNLETTDNRLDLLDYIQYLRDITNDSKFPHIEIKSYEEFIDG